jgi:hypothetical protein
VIRDADRAPSSATPEAPRVEARAAVNASTVTAPVRGARSANAVVTEATGSAPDLNQIVERWDDLVSTIRGAGKSVAATALERASPAAVNARGDVTLALDEANPIYEQAIEAVKGDAVAALRRWFPGVQRLIVRSPEGSTAPPPRLTDEMVRSERIAALRKKDPVLDAAIDALDLDLAD